MFFTFCQTLETLLEFNFCLATFMLEYLELLLLLLFLSTCSIVFGSKISWNLKNLKNPMPIICIRFYFLFFICFEVNRLLEMTMCLSQCLALGLILILRFLLLTIGEHFVVVFDISLTVCPSVHLSLCCVCVFFFSFYFGMMVEMWFEILCFFFNFFSIMRILFALLTPFVCCLYFIC